jgi:eukaryotic-like serine/threonine-protein kinase
MEIAGRYTADREIGRGGMGAVWLGTDSVLGRQVALKRIGVAPGAGTPDLERAEREARLAARLNHPHVVAVFDLVEDDGQHWLVMEYVEGVNLAELVRRDGALSPDEAAPLLRQAADALAAAHEAGIVHRDVKPSNILVTADGQVKLSDFGIARAEADASLTQTGLVTGSPAYLAPEIASGSTATAAADVWSLGATAYHALAGRPPYEVGDNLMGALYRIVHEEPPRLAEAGWLSTMLEHTMVRDPELRWPVSRVRDFLEGGPLLADGTVAQAVNQSSTVVAAPAATAVASPVQPPESATPNASIEPQHQTQILAPTPSYEASRDQRRGSGTGVLIILVALFAVALFLLFAWLLGAFDDTDGSESNSGPGSETSSEATDGESPSSEGADPEATATAMEAFVTDYLATVTSDPESAWEMLTPAFQEASGGFEAYRGFWDTVESATVVSIEADPDALTVSYTVEYEMNRGKGKGQTRQDDVTLQLEENGDGFLIADEL